MKPVSIKLADRHQTRRSAAGRTGQGQGDVDRSTTKRTVLLVEDNTDHREIARSLLEAEGFDVWVASNGREALEVLGRELHQPSVIITDLLMPVMDGWKLLEALKA